MANSTVSRLTSLGEHQQQNLANDMLALLPTGKHLYEDYKSEDFLQPLSDSLLEVVPHAQLQKLLFHRRCLRTALYYNDHMEATQIEEEKKIQTTYLRILFTDIYPIRQWFLQRTSPTRPSLTEACKKCYKIGGKLYGYRHPTNTVREELLLHDMLYERGLQI